MVHIIFINFIQWPSSQYWRWSLMHLNFRIHVVICWGMLLIELPEKSVLKCPMKARTMSNIVWAITHVADMPNRELAMSLINQPSLTSLFIAQSFNSMVHAALRSVKWLVLNCICSLRFWYVCLHRHDLFKPLFTERTYLFFSWMFTWRISQSRWSSGLPYLHCQVNEKNVDL